MILSDDVSDDDSIDDGTDCDGDYVERRVDDSESAEFATSDDYCCNAIDVDTTDKCLHWRGKSYTGIPSRWQNILTKLPGVIGQTKKATASLATWNCPNITNDLRWVSVLTYQPCINCDSDRTQRG